MTERAVRVEREGDFTSHNLPFKFDINGERVAQMMRTGLGLSEDVIDRAIFVLNGGAITRHLEVRVEKTGLSIREGFIAGQTPVNKDDQGQRRVLVNVGTLIHDFTSAKSDLLDYCYLGKKDDLPSGLEENVDNLAGKIDQGFNRRMSHYLESASLERAEKFLDKYLARRFARQLSHVVVHEASHLGHVDEDEDINKSLSWKRKAYRYFDAARYGGMAGFVTYSFMTDSVVLKAITLGVAAGGAGAQFALRRLMVRDMKKITDRIDEKEEQAEADATDPDLRTFSDLVRMEPNLDYQPQHTSV